MERSPNSRAEWSHAMREQKRETADQGNISSGANEDVDTRDRTNFPYPMTDAPPVQQDRIANRSSRSRGTAQQDGAEEALPEVYPSAPWNQTHSDAEAGRYPEAESTRSDKDYVSIQRSRRTWRD